MSKTRFAQWIVLVCMGSVAACTSGDSTTAGNTELNVIVPTNAGTPDAIDLQTVEYTINCAGNNDVFLDNAASFPDEVVLNGNLEVVDGRTDAQGAIPPEFGTPRPGDGAEIWQGFMDLPPGPCTVQLRARDNDGEVICTATEPFVITADSTAKVNLVLICNTSFQAPVGMLDVDATFSFNVGNFCPDLFILNCVDSAPAGIPFPGAPGACSITAATSCFFDTECPAGETCEGEILIAATTCEVRYRDGDSTCGQGCDPQSCVATPEGMTCTPGPDPGVSTTVSCVGGYIDCDFNPITPETECVFAGDQLGALPLGGPILPNTPGLSAFAAGCVPPALGGAPGATITCTAVTTDGDLDCDKTKVVEVKCPGLTPCEQYAADGWVCSDGNECSSDSCNSALAVGGSCGGADNGVCCETPDAPDGSACTSAAPPASCQGGVCTSSTCNVGTNPDANCNDFNECTVPNTCNVGTGLCEPLPPVNEASGVSCDAGLGASSGACDGAATCVDICVFNPACPDPGVECQVADCDPADGTCGSTAGPDGTTCDFSGPGSAEGTCSGGVCLFFGETCNWVQTGADGLTQSQVVSVGCTNNVTAAQSPFPFILEVDAPVVIFGGAAFSVNLTGLGFFPEFFLDAAQGVVCGGITQAELLDFVATVQVRSGATGADVPLGIDLGALSPGALRFCNFPTEQTCTCPGGTPAGSTCANGACLGGTCGTEGLFQDLPVLNGTPNSAGGCDFDASGCPGTPGPPTDCDCTACAAIDIAPATTKADQCAANGFCQNGSLGLPMEIAVGNYTADATGSVLWGWSGTPATVPGLTLCPDAACTNAGALDGCWQLPTAATPVDPVGLRVNAGGLVVPIRCAMGEDGGACSTTTTQGCLVDADCPGAETCIGVGVDDDIICPSPDSALIACPIN